MSYSPDVQIEFQRRLHTSWRDLAVHLGIPSHEIRAFPPGDEPREIWEWLKSRKQLGRLPVALVKIGRDDLAKLLNADATRLEPAHSSSPAAPVLHGLRIRSHPWFGRRWVATAAAVAALVLLGSMAVAVTLRRSGDRFPRLTLAPVRSQDWTTPDAPCVAQTTWRHRFDDNYRGDVYVQLTPTAPSPKTATVALSWGGLRWRRTIVAQPGFLDRGQGGTLLRFVKKDSIRSNPADWNPGVTLHASVPLCATFGTANTRPRPAPITYVDTPGWTPDVPLAEQDPRESPDGSSQAPLTPALRIDPQDEQSGTTVRLDGSGYIRGEPVRVEIFAGVGLKDFAGPYFKGDYTANTNGEIHELLIEIDREICCAGATIFIRATGRKSHAAAQQTFRLR